MAERSVNGHWFKDKIMKINMKMILEWKTDIAIGSGMSCLLCLVFFDWIFGPVEVLLSVVKSDAFLGRVWDE